MNAKSIALLLVATLCGCAASVMTSHLREERAHSEAGVRADVPATIKP